MPMTDILLACETIYGWQSRTVVNRLELRNDVQSDIRELIFEHLEEHGKQM